MRSGVPMYQQPPGPAQSANLQTLAAALSDSSPPRRMTSTVKMLQTSVRLENSIPEHRASTWGKSMKRFDHMLHYLKQLLALTNFESIHSKAERSNDRSRDNEKKLFHQHLFLPNLARTGFETCSGRTQNWHLLCYYQNLQIILCNVCYLFCDCFIYHWSSLLIPYLPIWMSLIFIKKDWSGTAAAHDFCAHYMSDVPVCLIRIC